MPAKTILWHFNHTENTKAQLTTFMMTDPRRGPGKQLPMININVSDEAQVCWKMSFQVPAKGILINSFDFEVALMRFFTE